MSEGCLSGVKVLEHTQIVAGPYCSKVLADLGAEVIKIEKPGLGDDARRRAPFLNDIPHPERSGLFLYLNTNKLGITLNPNTKTGREIFEELVKEVDILIEDNPPQTIREQRLDYNNLKEINPKLIVVSITPFGQTGPYRDYKAYPLNTFHAGGLGYLVPFGSTFPSRPPLKWGDYCGEYVCGLVAAVATLGALYAQQTDGVGQHIDVSKQEALLSLLRVFAAYYPNQKRIADRFSGLFGDSSFSQLFSETMCPEDSEAIVVAAFSHQIESLIKLTGGDAEDAKGEMSGDAFQLLPKWMSNRTKEEIYQQAQAARIPAAPIRNVEEVVNSEQFKARRFFREIEHPEMGKVKIPTTPYHFSKTPWKIERPAPLLGQHNEDIYCRRLGHTKEDMVKLREGGII